MKLNKAQSAILIVAAFVTSIAIFLQAMERGWSDTPWLIGAIVVTIMLLVAYSSRAKNNSVTDPNLPNSRLKNQSPGRPIRYGEPFFSQTCSELTDFLLVESDKLRAAAGVHVDAPKLQALMLDHTEFAACKWAYMLFAADGFRRDIEYFGSKEHGNIRRYYGGRASKIYEEIFTEVRSSQGIEPPQSAVSLAKKDLEECDRAVLRTLTVGSGEFSIAPIHALINNEVPIANPTELEGKYGAQSKRILRALAGAVRP